MEAVTRRRNCADLNDRMIEYELCDDPPRFPGIRSGDLFTVVLRDAETHQLEEIGMRIVGGQYWIGSRDIYKIWGEIIADDMDENYSTLHFEYDERGNIERIYAVRDVRSMPPEKADDLAKKAGYAAGFTALADPFSKRSQ